MPAKRRIVHLISSLESGGCENMLLRTLPRLQDTTDEHLIVTLFRPGELAPAFRSRGIRHISVGGFGRLVPLLRYLEPALILTYLFHADMVGRLWVRPQLATPAIPFLRTTYNDASYLPARIAEWMTKGLVGRYLANSEAVKDFYVRAIGVNPQRITVLPNGIDAHAFRKADRQRVPRELRLPKQRFVVTCVANFAPNKGHRFLLEAFARFARNRGACYLLLVGSGSEEAALRRQADATTVGDRIHFLGRRHDVPAILGASDVFVLPTLFEGMSNAIQEAMAAGLPVITTDIPENRALIHHEETGLLVPVLQHDPIASALGRLYGDAPLRRRLGVAAARAIEDRFGMPAVLQQWRRAIDEAMV